GDELYDILAFIYQQNQNNAEVSLKNISKDFGIVSKTTAKRIKILEDKGLIFIKKRGRLKTLHVSQKGKTLLHKRQMV
ncbi:MAG: winged helix-turn-helix transcriptional regulator, partial [Thermoplasmatales archaeon]